MRLPRETQTVPLLHGIIGAQSECLSWGQVGSLAVSSATSSLTTGSRCTRGARYLYEDPILLTTIIILSCNYYYFIFLLASLT